MTKNEKVGGVVVVGLSFRGLTVFLSGNPSARVLVFLPMTGVRECSTDEYNGDMFKAFRPSPSVRKRRRTSRSCKQLPTKRTLLTACGAHGLRERGSDPIRARVCPGQNRQRMAGSGRGGRILRRWKTPMRSGYRLGQV